MNADERRWDRPTEWQRDNLRAYAKGLRLTIRRQPCRNIFNVYNNGDRVAWGTYPELIKWFDGVLFGISVHRRSSAVKGSAE